MVLRTEKKRENDDPADGGDAARGKMGKIKGN